ncbi:mediator of RNA polymerase II transcription subunit 31-like isoform X2 [Salvia miltiorrhiza]|uniref:mediator of RNA polymerase II transcription subunit 31-like isoform X2 n=1 Tax=Salvia miltiorrhiza TaxID=226208 RepID=UPI0025AB5F13|nr:mediator of RNA polymerase II transcription subunit 31-like isoform X2 [Salvia miltiorrhiza]
MASDPMELVTNPPSPPKTVYKDPDDGRQRFLLELEFVQCLANPTYIHYNDSWNLGMMAASEIDFLFIILLVGGLFSKAVG